MKIIFLEQVFLHINFGLLSAPESVVINDFDSKTGG
jgi:hypothetical protein